MTLFVARRDFKSNCGVGESSAGSFISIDFDTSCFMDSLPVTREPENTSS